jgi:hypothetical protein
MLPICDTLPVTRRFTAGERFPSSDPAHACSWPPPPGTRFREGSAGIGKLGAFIGVFQFPVLQQSLGLRGTLLLTAGISVLGALLTLALPEPAGRSLEEISGEADIISAAEQVIRNAGEPAPTG